MQTRHYRPFQSQRDKHKYSCKMPIRHTSPTFLAENNPDTMRYFAGKPGIAAVSLFITDCSLYLPTFLYRINISQIDQHIIHFPPPKKNYFTSSDPHHDMLGGGCQVRVVIENMMGRMENLRTLISGFLGLVILVRWALVTMVLS